LSGGNSAFTAASSAEPALMRRCGQGRRERDIGRFGLGELCLQTLQRALALVERSKVCRHGLRQRRQRIDRDIEFARRRAQRKQPLLDALQNARIEFGSAYRCLQRLPCLLQRDHRRGQRRDRGVDQLRRLGGAALQPAQHARQGGNWRSGTAHRLIGFDDVAGDLLGSHHALAPRCQRLFLTRLGCELAELGHGMAQEIGLLAGGLDPHALALQGLARLFERLAGTGDLGRLRGQLAKAVEDGAVLGRVGESAVVMLTMDLDERRADHPQDLDADRLVVDEGAGAPVGILHAPQDQVAVGVDLLRLGEGPRRMRHRQVEDRADLALRLAMAHQAAVTACAQRQREAVEQDRLAGTGLAGQHAEPVLEAQVEPVDQNDVADRELSEHGDSAPLCRLQMTSPGHRPPQRRPRPVNPTTARVKPLKARLI
jgi:hypothetical protein